MTRANSSSSDVIQRLRDRAMRNPDTQEGVACEGTSVERRTVKARGKAFLFLGVADIRLKLGASLAEATALASKAPRSVKVGTRGWVAVDFSDGEGPSCEILERWVDESYALTAKSNAPTSGRSRR